MKALWIYADAGGKSRIKPLPLAITKIKKPLDPEIFRRQARGENVGHPRLFPSTGLRSMRVVGERNDAWHSAECRQLVFVVAGRIELTVGDGSTSVLAPGDLFFEDDTSGQGHRLRYIGDCRLLFLGVADSWLPEGEFIAETAEASSHQDKEPLLRCMYTAADSKAYFRPFDELFAAASDQSSGARPTVGFHFVHFPPGSFIDWHPEGVNNFVVVMTGKLELEVSGDRAVETFGPGDVCLAADRTGEGHIDRAHGDLRVALVVLEDQHLWIAPGDTRHR